MVAENPYRLANIPAAEGSESTYPIYYVVFCHQVVAWWLRLLRKGFRHCFLLAAYPHSLVVLDPLSRRWLLQALPPLSQERLEALLTANDLRFVKVAAAEPQPEVMPPAFINCVSVVKRLLGIRSFLPITPYGLYIFLRRANNSLQFAKK